MCRAKSSRQFYPNKFVNVCTIQRQEESEGWGETEADRENGRLTAVVETVIKCEDEL